MKYYEGFSHTNSSDNEEDVVSLTSTSEEKKKINKILIFSETNDGVMRWYVERERVGTHYTNKATIQNALEFEVDRELAEGETFKITLKNVSSGTNAAIVGAIEYEIL